jgi:hypothetical protein
MGGWTQIFTSAPDYVADPNSIDQNEGGQIDWSRVPDSYRAGTQYTVTTTAQSNAGTTTLTVSAIPADLPVGTVLNFAGAGRFATLTAPAAKGATTLTVEALDACRVTRSCRGQCARVRKLPSACWWGRLSKTCTTML